MEPMYIKLVQLNDEWTEAGLQLQVADPASKYDGGVMDETTGIPRANHLGTPAVMAAWAASLVNADSRYYRQAELREALEKASAFLLRRQHADGTISLGSTNFNSPPDTAFVVGGMTQIYRMLEQANWSELAPALANIRLFLERTIPALLTGGCHTPNHRWVITAALVQLHDIFDRPELLVRAEEWLSEGMDMTEDGEWTERSNGIYNAVSNISLFHTARVLNRPALLEYVRRNLRMMAYLIHPDGEVVTDYSGRQDLGQTFNLSNYFLVCRLMAAHDRDPLFAALSDYAGSFISQYKEGVNNHPMVGVLLFPSSLEGLEREPLPERYVKRLNFGHPMDAHLKQVGQVGHHMKIQHSSMHLAFGAPVVRMRDGNDSVTMMAKAPSFFSLRHGKARLLGVKLATSFAPGVVMFDSLEEAEQGAFKLRTLLEKGYSGPIPAASLRELRLNESMSPWYLLPHHLRPMTHLQQFELAADITQGDQAWTLRLRSDEREDVFVQLTFVFGSEGEVEGSGVEPISDGRFLYKEGTLSYSAGPDVIEIASGAFEHRLPELRDVQHPNGCLYAHVNLLSPFDHTVTIRLR
ncbi:hypothetical protein [Paenibacillus ferrarius]|uniref:hypothetical protein n=1 Tax=Paenibacillus ferrarius TaxID=1469647 RepID=UPI003D2D9AD3